MELQIIVMPSGTSLYTNTELSSDEITTFYADTQYSSICYSTNKHIHLVNARTDEEIRYIEQLMSIDPKSCFFDGILYVEDGKTHIDLFHPRAILNNLCDSIEQDDNVTFDKFMKKRVNDYIVNV